MKHQAIFFIADRFQNAFMAKLDLRPEFKWYVHLVEANFETTTQITDGYFQGLIEKSKSEKGYWIPAIKYMNNFYHAPLVKILSDGETEMFIRKTKEDI